MTEAWKLALLTVIFTQAPLAGASSVSLEGNKGPVVAMDAIEAKGYRARELIEAGADTKLLVGRSNSRVELSPRSVVEFDDSGALRVLRGSAVVESREEAVVSTPGARVELVGKALVSFDRKEQSTSVFTLEGESRLVNASREDGSVRLHRFRGATLSPGDVLPHTIHQLDVGSVDAWLKGFAWPEGRRQSFLRGMPGELVMAEEATPKHLASVRIEDYFSSIETADEQHQPDYYDKRFGDQDAVVAEQNSKQGPGKMLSPEEAALISLPKTKIDLDFGLGPEFVTVDQKMKEVAMAESFKEPARAPASVKPKPARVAAKPKARKAAGDPDVSLVLQRLRQVRSGGPMPSAPAERAEGGRAPASVPALAVPDPIYDYSQNF